jgi:DNA-binding NarL/FixJ family response regulator
MQMLEQSIHPLIRIVLADDHPLLRSGVRAALEANSDLTVVGEAADGYHVVPCCRETSPDVLLLDLQMPGPGPLAIITELRTHCPTIPILVLTAHTDLAHIRGVLAAGVAGYILKEEPAEAVVTAVRVVVSGGTWLSRSIAATLGQGTSELSPEAINLSDPALTILRLLAEGRSNREIGQMLGVSEKSIERRVSEICAQLGVTTRVAAAVRAVREGLI